jgi:uncharacterized protein YndB with AHSA1/START domain
MVGPLTFKVTRRIAAPSHAVWNVIGDFGREHRWTKNLLHCERDTETVRVGTSRICTLPKPLMGRTSVREQLTEYEPGRSLAYKLDGPAGPFATASSRWRTAPAPTDTTDLTVEGMFTPRNTVARLFVWPLAKPFLRHLAARALGELEAFVLAGATSTSR